MTGLPQHHIASQRAAGLVPLTWNTTEQGTRTMEHASHPKIVARLKRAHGHLGSVLAMFEEGRGCMDLAQQLHAVENAVASAKRQLIHDHIENCLDGTGSGGKAAVSEMKQLAKYL